MLYVQVKDNASILEVARDKIVFDMTKTIADFIGKQSLYSYRHALFRVELKVVYHEPGSCSMNRGFLATRPGEGGHAKSGSSHNDVESKKAAKDSDDSMSPEKQVESYVTMLCHNCTS